MTANRPEGHDRLGPPPRALLRETPDTGWWTHDCLAPCHRCTRPLSSSALLPQSELVECPVRASLRAAAIERAYACSAARVVPARVGAAAVAEAWLGLAWLGLARARTRPTPLTIQKGDEDAASFGRPAS